MSTLPLPDGSHLSSAPTGPAWALPKWPDSPGRTCTDVESLGRLAASWRFARERTNSPINRACWWTTCAEAFAPAGGVYAPAILHDGQPVAVAPLLRRSIKGIDHAVMLGAAELYEPMDLVYEDAEALDHLAAALIQDGQPLFFERLPADSPTIEAFKRVGRRSAVVICRPGPGCPYIPLDEQWAEPERQLNSGRRSDLRRARRRAEERGKIDVEILTPRPDELDGLLETAFEIEARSWKGETGTALLCDPCRLGFYRRYAHAASREGILRLCFLRIGGEAVAMQMAVQCAGGFWLLKIGYDAAYAQCAPGLLLMRETIRHAVEEGLKSYEFLGMIAPWTKVWTQHERHCASLRVYPFSPSGMAALTLKTADTLLHRWGLR